jgi:hypothetical protein
MKSQIPFVGTLGDIGKLISGCGFPDGGQTLAFTEKFWEPALVGGRLIHCANDLSPLVKLFEKAQKANPEYFDKTDSEELGVVIVAIEQALKVMVKRLVWFGDKVADNIAGGGVYKDGVDVSFYTPINGLWKQILAEIPTNSTNYVAITANAGASYAEQVLGAGVGLSTLRAMYNKATPEFHQAIADGAVAKFYVTRELAQNYIDGLETASLAFQLAGVESGGIGLNYRGIPISIKDEWNAHLKRQDNGTKFNLPNRALLTVKANIPVATLSEDDLKTVDSFYDQKDKSNYMDFAVFLDAKFLSADLAVAAY